MNLISVGVAVCFNDIAEQRFISYNGSDSYDDEMELHIALNK